MNSSYYKYCKVDGKKTCSSPAKITTIAAECINRPYESCTTTKSSSLNDTADKSSGVENIEVKQEIFEHECFNTNINNSDTDKTAKYNEVPACSTFFNDESVSTSEVIQECDELLVPVLEMSFNEEPCKHIHLKQEIKTEHPSDEETEGGFCAKLDDSNNGDEFEIKKAHKPKQKVLDKKPKSIKGQVRNTSKKTHLKVIKNSPCFTETEQTVNKTSSNSNTLQGITVERQSLNEKKPYQCTKCEKSFRNTTHLAMHTRTHTGVKPYKCHVCHRSFSVSSNLKRHSHIHTGERRYQCEICQKKFTTSSQLTIHLRTHTGERPFNCSVCNKRFSQSSDFKIHLRTHTGELPFQCSVCNMKFKASGILKKHLRTHTDAKPFQCKLCEKRFRRNCTLTIHLRTHTGEKPYQCSVCEKRFSRSYVLREHLKIHSRHQFYQCAICNEKFTMRCHIIKHLKSH